MTEPQDFDSIDQLFRKTLNDLPDTPSPNGWDTPSEKVWQNVSANIPQPESGWNWKPWALAGTLFAVLAIGLFWILTPGTETAPDTPANDNTAVETPADNAPEQKSTEEQATPEAPSLLSPEQQEEAQPSGTTAATTRPGNTNANAAAVQQQNQPEEGSVITAPFKFPNTRDKLKAEREEELKRRWRTPLKPLPTTLEKKLKAES